MCRINTASESHNVNGGFLLPGKVVHTVSLSTYCFHIFSVFGCRFSGDQNVCGSAHLTALHLED